VAAWPLGARTCVVLALFCGASKTAVTWLKAIWQVKMPTKRSIDFFMQIDLGLNYKNSSFAICLQEKSQKKGRSGDRP
jgi:hypothetical protein